MGGTISMDQLQRDQRHAVFATLQDGVAMRSTPQRATHYFTPGGLAILTGDLRAKCLEAEESRSTPCPQVTSEPARSTAKKLQRSPIFLWHTKSFKAFSFSKCT